LSVGSSELLGGSISITSGLSSTADGGALTMLGGSGSSGGGSVNIGAGLASSSGSGGDVTIFSGQSTLSSGGSVSLLVGDSVSTSGGDINLTSGSSTGGLGGNIYLEAGAGTASGSVYFVDPSSSSNFGVISDSTFDFSGQSSVSMSSTGTVQLSASTTMSFTATNGISMGDSNVSGFEKGSQTVGHIVPGELILNTMSGKIISESTDLAASDTDTITLYNSRVSASSLVMVTPSSSGGCMPNVYEAEPAPGYVTIKVINAGSTACTSAYTLSFLVVN